MSDTDGDGEKDDSAIPHPVDCDHKFILKGAGHSGSRGLPLFQCEHCGYSFQRDVRGGNHKDETIFKGWNPKPEPEDEDDEDDDSGGFWS